MSPGQTAHESLALAALKRTPATKIPDGVREHIRRVFLTGEESEAEPHAPVPLALPMVSRGVAWRRAAAVAAGLAAAVAVVFFVRAGLQPEGIWHVTDAVEPEDIELPGGSPVWVDSAAQPAGVRSGVVRVGARSELELELDTRLRLRLLSGTDATIPAAPTRFGRDRTLEVRRGEIFGASFQPLGFRLRLSTPEAEAVLSGTSFAAIRNDEATCFCLYRGHLDVTAGKTRGRIDLPLEHRVVVYRDGRPPRIEPLTDRERMKLSMLEAARPGAPPGR